MDRTILLQYFYEGHPDSVAYLQLREYRLPLARSHVMMLAADLGSHEVDPHQHPRAGHRYGPCVRARVAHSRESWDSEIGRPRRRRGFRRHCGWDPGLAGSGITGWWRNGRCGGGL